MTKRISPANTVVVPIVETHVAEGKAEAAKVAATAAEVEAPAKADIVVEVAAATADEPVIALVSAAPLAMVAQDTTTTTTTDTTTATTTSADTASVDGDTDYTPYIVGGVLLAGGILAIALSSGDDEDSTPPAPTNSAPTFTSGTTATVAENAAITTVVYDANATDPQNNAIVYSLGGTDAALFAIDSATGVVTLRASANFETRATYSITVTATDNATPPLSTSQTIAVTVTNVNEAPSFATATATATVAENIPITTTVFTAAATDVDAGTTLTYSLTGTDAAAFAINATTGVVTFRASPDFETKATYSFNVVATDAATNGLTATQAVTVNVTDVAEGPVFTSGATATVAENAATTTVVYDANATGATSFAISGANAGLFNIDATTGVVTLRAPANFEAPNAGGYNFTVTATGATGTTTQNVAVTLTDVNEAPTFAAATRTVSFAENTPTTTAVIAAGAVGATDPDGATTANGRLTYSLTGTDAALFNVDATTGAVTFRASPDFEATPTKTVFNFNLVATDAGTTPLSASQAVTVNLTNVAEPTDGTRIDGAGIPATTSVSYDAANGNVTFFESGSAANISVINNFTAGDIIQTDTATTNYSFSSDGTTLNISYNNAGVVSQISLAGAVSATAFVFNEASAEQAIGFDFFRGAALPAAAASLDVGTANTAVTLNAATNAFTYNETAGTASNVVINNFSSDDRIVVTGATGASQATSYSFTSSDNDLIISFNNAGVVSNIVINDVVSPNAFVFNEASAEAAVGFDFFRYA
ncbi:Cadherin domain-containing protein [Sphingomonas guangdongensis]|uniref:Cadherin domain-containing protein n=1 Tax=Sphingomonas guangdongensis TaxID=1141890 RepID=A0A285R388_9SPHN|nr:cadherin repeat domain-containing protein [Sphingomonas guangdongensis]SOB86827.1 Cadherin domain-containing protein [Sphingomonas guangdongensis]